MVGLGILSDNTANETTEEALKTALQHPEVNPAQELSHDQEQKAPR